MSDVSLSLLVLKTRQIDRMCEFYAILGIDLVQEQHGKGPAHYSGRVGGTLLEIYPLPDDHPIADATTRLGFTVKDLSLTLGTLNSRGAPVVSKAQATEWGERAIVRDPDGRAVELYAAVPVT